MAAKILPIVLMIIILLVVFLVHVNNRDSILVKEFVFIAGSAFMLVLTAYALLRGEPLYAERLTRPVLLLFACICVWMITTHFIGVRSVNGKPVFFSFVSLGGIVVSLALMVDSRWRSRILWILVVSSVLLSLYSILQWRGIHLFRWDAVLSRSGRVSGSLGNPNLLGSFMCAVVPAGICFLAGRNAPKVQRTVSVVLMAILGCLALVASGTRGSLIGLGTGIIVIAGAIIFRKTGINRKHRIAVVILLVLLLTVSVVMMAPRLSEVFQQGSGTVQVRKLIWSGTLGMIGSRPLTGWGPGSFQIVFPQFRNPLYHLFGVSHNTLHAHSEYLEILSDTGVIGALLWALMIIALIKMIRRRIDWNITSIGLIAGIAAIMAEAIVSVALRWPSTAFLMALFLGLLFTFIKVPARPVHGAGKFLSCAAAVIMALILICLVVPSYLNTLKAGEQLFMGKDLFLARIEPEMNRAHSAALNWERTGNQEYRDEALYWWQTAARTADSSIARCRLASELNPDNLGAWYALGSAGLTRAMIAQPQNPFLIRSLEESGIQAVDIDYAVQLTLDALEAYDSLAARAPNYAEMHNNLALAYTRLGRLDDAFRSLRQSYAFFGHRRADYMRQITSLHPLKPENYDAWHLLWIDTPGNYFMTNERDERYLEKLSMILNDKLWFSGICMYMDPQHADSIYNVFMADIEGVHPELMEDFRQKITDQINSLDEAASLLQRYESGDTTGILDEVRYADPLTGVILPVQNYILGMLLCDRGDIEGLAILRHTGISLYFNAGTVISEWPGKCTHVDRMIDFVLDSEQLPELDDYFCEAVIQLLLLDHVLYYSNRLATEDFKSDTDPLTARKLSDIWSRLGGPRHAFYTEGGTEPWLYGSVLEDTAERLALLSDENPDDPYYELLEMRFYYILFSSLWWETPVFKDEQNVRIFESIRSCKLRLSEILGEEEVIYQIGTALAREQSRLRMWESDESQPVIENFRDDIIHISH